MGPTNSQEVRRQGLAGPPECSTRRIVSNPRFSSIQCADSGGSVRLVRNASLSNSTTTAGPAHADTAPSWWIQKRCLHIEDAPC